MVVSYNTGSPSAAVKLTAIHSAHGGVVRETISWDLIALDASGEPSERRYDSNDAQPDLMVHPGKYSIVITYKEDKTDCGEYEFLANTASDLVFLLNDNGLFDSGKEYNAETDPFFEHDRRRDDREHEIDLGEIVTPLKDPNKKPESGTNLSAHPLLSEQAQFDGMPPEITPDPTENEEAGNKAELKLQQQLQQQNTAQATHTSTPSPFG